tara:strand:- start:75 stop:581 length:507 start_codon:yes stop_codon:yes gene_type:complete
MTKSEVDSDNEEVIMDESETPIKTSTQDENSIEELDTHTEMNDDESSDNQGSNTDEIQNLMKAMMQGMSGEGGDEDDENDEDDEDYEDEDEDDEDGDDEDGDGDENDIDIQELLMQYFENEERQNIPTILSDIKFAIDNNSKCILKLVTEVRKAREDTNNRYKKTSRK